MANNNRDKCEKCGAISNTYHYIYDEKLKKLNWVWISRKAGEGELVFCSKEHCKAWTALCNECWKYRKGENWQRTDKDDGKRFCSEKCCNKYYAPTCDYCHKGKGYYNKKKENDGKHFCSQEHLNIFYAPICDNCQKQCLKYSRGKPVDSECYYNDEKNKTGNICVDCNKKKGEYICDKCGETKLGNYWFNKDKNDDKKFCSNNCFGIYYGYYVENCQECSKKMFKSYQSYCSTCKWKHEAEMRKEEAEKRKKAKELKDSCNNDLETVHCRYCGKKCPSIFNVCEKKECLDKMNKGVEGKNNDKRENDNKSNLNYFKSNSIAEVELTDEGLNTRYSLP